MMVLSTVPSLRESLNDYSVHLGSLCRFFNIMTVIISTTYIKGETRVWSARLLQPEWESYTFDLGTWCCLYKVLGSVCNPVSGHTSSSSNSNKLLHLTDAVMPGAAPGPAHEGNTV